VSKGLLEQMLNMLAIQHNNHIWFIRNSSKNIFILLCQTTFTSVIQSTHFYRYFTGIQNALHKNLMQTKYTVKEIHK